MGPPLQQNLMIFATATLACGFLMVFLGVRGRGAFNNFMCFGGATLFLLGATTTVLFFSGHR